MTKPNDTRDLAILGDGLVLATAPSGIFMMFVGPIVFSPTYWTVVLSVLIPLAVLWLTGTSCLGKAGLMDTFSQKLIAMATFLFGAVFAAVVVAWMKS